MEAKRVDGAKAQLKAGDHSLLSSLFDVVLERTTHVYNGECPEPNHLDWRDEDCPACQVLLRVEAFLSTTATVEDEASVLLATIQRLTAERDALAERMACAAPHQGVDWVALSFAQPPQAIGADLEFPRENDVSSPPILR
jgi:hypothetical protein